MIRSLPLFLAAVVTATAGGRMSAPVALAAPVSDAASRAAARPADAEFRIDATDFAAAAPLVSLPSSLRSGVIRTEADAVMVEQAWARASAGNATTGAAYVTLKAGAQPDRLVGVGTQAAATAEVHESFTENGVMKMRPVPALPVPPGQTVTLAPGGYHIMMTGLKQPLVAGQSFPLTLRFEHAQPVTIDVQVRAIGREAPNGGPGHDQMHRN